MATVRGNAEIALSSFSILLFCFFSDRAAATWPPALTLAALHPRPLLTYCLPPLCASAPEVTCQAILLVFESAYDAMNAVGMNPTTEEVERRSLVACQRRAFAESGARWQRACCRVALEVGRIHHRIAGVVAAAGIAGGPLLPPRSPTRRVQQERVLLSKSAGHRGDGRGRPSRADDGMEEQRNAGLGWWGGRRRPSSSTRGGGRRGRG